MPTTIALDLKGCGTNPTVITLPELQCLPVDELKANEIKVGGRVVLVTPYKAGGQICSGQYGQWQVLTGLGGQINRGLYVGSSFSKVSGIPNPGVTSTVDETDCCKADPDTDGGPNGDKALAIRERGRWYVVKLAQGSGVSGAPPPLCSVLGGNVPPITFKLTADPLNTDPLLDEQGYEITPDSYPSNRPFAFSLKTIESNQLLLLPRVKDWTRFDLPLTYKIGDALPRLPDGLCYLLLERPTVLAGSSWLSRYDIPLRVAASTIAAPFILAARTVSGDVMQAKVKWSRPIALPSSPTQDLYHLTFTPYSGSPVVLTVTAVTLDSSGWITTITYEDPSTSTDIDPLLGTLALTVSAGAVLSTATPAVGNNTVTDTPVAYTYEKFSVAVGMNRQATQAFAFGDLVIVSPAVVALADELGVSRNVIDIITVANAAGYPHEHLTDGGGPLGGGRAYLTAFGLSQAGG